MDLEPFAESPVVEVGRTLQLRQETVRGILAVGFGIIFAGVVGYQFGSLTLGLKPLIGSNLRCQQ